MQGMSPEAFWESDYFELLTLLSAEDEEFDEVNPTSLCDGFDEL